MAEVGTIPSLPGVLPLLPERVQFLDGHLAGDLNDQPGAQSWPIESATFVLLPTDPKDPAQSAAVEKFFNWGFSKGGALATQLLYIPLPVSVQGAVRSAWSSTVKK